MQSSTAKIIIKIVVSSLIYGIAGILVKNIWKGGI